MLRTIASFKSEYRLSISIHNEFKVWITLVLSVIIASSVSGNLAKKCRSILLNKVNSTFFGSTKTNFTSAGCFLYNNEAKTRSEEHTSELQSRPHLVCRLL